jgi:hypothetical protein
VEARRRTRTVNLVVAAILVVGVGTAVQGRMTQEEQQSKVDKTSIQSVAYERQRNVLATDVQTLRQQVTFCKQHPKNDYCKKPAVPDPQQRIKEIPGPQGATGPQGAQGPAGRSPTEGEVAAAVASYLASHPVKDGRPPTQAEISAAVAAYLAKNPPPAGPAGKNGTDGQQGATGPQGPAGPEGPQGLQGEPGKDASDEQVKTAVDAYFASHTFSCTEDETGKWKCAVAN